MPNHVVSQGMLRIKDTNMSLLYEEGCYICNDFLGWVNQTNELF